MIDIAKLFIVRYFFIEDIAISSEYLPLKLNSRFESQFFAYSTNTYGKFSVLSWFASCWHPCLFLVKNAIFL